jgi:hypothetical protein
MEFACGWKSPRRFSGAEPIGSKDYRTAAVRGIADIDRVGSYHAGQPPLFVVSLL